VLSKDPFIRAMAISMFDKIQDPDDTYIRVSCADKHPAVREKAIRLAEVIYGPVDNLIDETDKRILNYVNRKNNIDAIKSKDQNRVKGSLYGLIAGDALGAPVEGETIDMIKDKYGVLKDFVKKNNERGISEPGSYTDDGELALAIMNSISENQMFDPYNISKRFGEIGERVDSDFSTNIGYGYKSLMAFRKLYVGVNWRFTGNNSSGCGAAMRVAPIAAISSLEDLEDNVKDQALITHNNPLAIAGALTIGYAINRAYDLSQGFNRLHLIDDITKYVSPVSNELSKEISLLKHLIDVEPSIALPQFPITDSEIKRKGKGTLGTIPASLYAFLHTPDNFEETIINAVNNSGDSDSIGAMAGAISGAYNGYDRIPERLIGGLCDREWIGKCIQKFMSIS
jgi:ADP-ribosyl-[dinitrogen reductase] hydrolase